MRARTKVLVLTCIWMAITGCGEYGGTPSQPRTSQESASSPESEDPDESEGDDRGWDFFQEQSAVFGTQHVAMFSAEVEGFAGYQSEIEIRCTPEKPELKVQFRLLAEDGLDPSFNLQVPSQCAVLGLCGAAMEVTGSGRTALTPKPISSSLFLSSSDYKNQATLYRSSSVTSDSPFSSKVDSAWAFVGNLPIAVALNSNIGAVEFVIPDAEAIRDIALKCASGPEPETFTWAQERQLENQRKQAAAEEEARALAEYQASRQALGLDVVEEPTSVPEESESPGHVGSAVPGDHTAEAIVPADTDPIRLHAFPPMYPSSALRERKSGIAVVWIDIDEAGRVIGVDVKESSGHRDLDKAAINAARNWKFKPATSKGSPISSRISVPIEFSAP